MTHTDDCPPLYNGWTEKHRHIIRRLDAIGIQDDVFPLEAPGRAKSFRRT